MLSNTTTWQTPWVGLVKTGCKQCEFTYQRHFKTLLNRFRSFCAIVKSCKPAKSDIIASLLHIQWKHLSQSLQKAPFLIRYIKNLPGGANTALNYFPIKLLYKIGGKSDPICILVFSKTQQAPRHSAAAIIKMFLLGMV